jgi:hypothetical protein
VACARGIAPVAFVGGRGALRSLDLLLLLPPPPPLLLLLLLPL